MIDASLRFSATMFWLGGVLLVVWHLDRHWRPIVRAYLEAKAAVAGKVMRVAAPDGEKPGRLLPPIRPENDESVQDVFV